MTLADLLEEIDADELRDRELSRPAPRTDREFRCATCGARYTRLTDGHSEAGHAFDCPRRLRRTGRGERAAPSLDAQGVVR